MYIIQKDIVFHASEDRLNQYGPDTYYIFAPKNFSPVFKKVLIDARMNLYKDEMVNPWTIWDPATRLESIRSQRDYLLSLSDWRVIRATETQTPESQAWINYRQALRDFPNLVNVNLPIEQIVWPQPPS